MTDFAKGNAMKSLAKPHGGIFIDSKSAKPKDSSDYAAFGEDSRSALQTPLRHYLHRRLDRSP